MKIVKYKNIDHQKIWDEYVKTSNNGTIFHERKFLSYHKDRDFDDSSLIFYEKNTIKALFSGAVIDKKLISHPGASFGGFVYNDMTFQASRDLIALLIEFCKKNGLNEITIIPTPFVYYNTYNEAMEYSLFHMGFQIKEYYISSFVDLKIDLLSQIHNRKKRYIRKIENDVTICESDNFDIFYPILIENKLKHKTKPTHSLEELKILAKLFPKRIKLLLSFYEKKVIGGSLIFITNSNSCILFYNMIDYNYKDLQVSSLQIYESLKWALKNNLKYFDIGVSQLYQNDKIIPHESLIRFKEQFGSKAMIRKVMSIKI